MTILEKTAQKSENELNLYKEGVFWIAYEKDAYLVSQIKKLKPTKKYIKTIQREIVCVGFPSSSLETVTTHFTVKKQEANLIVMETAVPAVQSDYDNWKKQIPLTEPRAGRQQAQVSVQAVPASRNDRLIEKLGAFKIHNATPIDCMNFIAELQKDMLEND